MLYQRGGKWWFKFRFAGREFREPAKTSSKTLARNAERKRRQQLEEGYHGLKKRQPPQTLKSASDAWLEMKRPTIAPKTYVIEKTHLSHILPVLGQKLISDIDPDDISRYQKQRLKDEASPKTVNLEVGTIRAILRRYRIWANIQPDVRMLATNDDVGKALPVEDEKRLLDGCAESRSRSLLPAVLLALNTGMRYSEMRLLHWSQIDLERRTVRVGKSKTEAGSGRLIPLNDKATKVLKFWAEQFPDRKPEHFAFPSERYGAGGDDFEPTVFDVDPETPIGSWKEACESAKRKTGVEVRFHDLRHTFGTQMARAGAPLRAIQEWMGHASMQTTLIYADYALDPHQGAAYADRAFAASNGNGTADQHPSHEAGVPVRKTRGRIV